MRKSRTFWTFSLTLLAALLPYLHSPQGLTRSVLPCCCGGGPLGYFGTPASTTLQPSNSAAFSRDQPGFGQDGAFHRSFEYFAGRVLFRDVGSAAGRNAH